MEQELERLRTENERMRSEVRAAIALFNRAGTRERQAPTNGRRRSSPGSPGAATAKTRRRRKSSRGRVTPAEVTPAVVRAALGRLGVGTAAEIAKVISDNGTPVSGRAIRFIAERAGAQVEKGSDGQRRYRLAG